MGQTSQKQPSKQEDPWVASVLSMVRWVQAQRMLLRGLGVAGLVALLGIVGMQRLQMRRARQAAERFDAAWTMLHPPEAAVKPTSRRAQKEAAPTGPARAPADDPNVLRGALPIFAEVAQAEPQAGIGTLAALLQGVLQARLDDEPTAARQTFAALAQRLPPRHPLYFLAIERLAYAHEAADDLAAAAAALEPLARDETLFYADVARFAQARLQAAQGDVALARQTLQSVEQTFPNSSLIDEVQAQLAALEATAPPADPNARPQ